MKKALVYVTVATLIVAQPVKAYAGNGGAIAAGIIGGLLLGAAAAHAANQPHHYVQRRRAVRQAVARPKTPAPTNVTYLTLSRDDPGTLRSFYNCNRRPVNTQAKAQNGFVRPRPSTRFVCGNPDFPVVEFEYAPARNGMPTDTVVYTDRGRVIFTDNITLDSAIHNSTRQPQQMVTIAQNEERSVWRVWNCNGSPSEISVFARTGFTTVRDGTADVCGATAYPVKEVYYRATSDSSGSDTVMIRSSTSAPTNIPIQVVSGEVARVQATVTSTQPTSIPGGSLDDETMNSIMNQK
ncbi:MAG: hypothetical protein JWL62_1235 [Hyphomicrobiales bacterium]|nr:hypothetical protein [Hyphomicrobiales bacterium]